MKAIKSFRNLVSVFVLILSTFSALAADRFPRGPVETMTPGALCDHPTTYRYPEHIPYCERNVSPATKKQIIRMYDQQFGYSIGKMNRGEFKIDHFIPLSIGGSNSVSNLWPQHRTVYEQTDELEHLLSQKISDGSIKQAEAVRVIREAKTNLERVPDLYDYVSGL